MEIPTQKPIQTKTCNFVMGKISDRSRGFPGVGIPSTFFFWTISAFKWGVIVWTSLLKMTGSALINETRTDNFNLNSIYYMLSKFLKCHWLISHFFCSSKIAVSNPCTSFIFFCTVLYLYFNVKNYSLDLSWGKNLKVLVVS